MSKRYLSIVALLVVVVISLGVRAGLAADDESPTRGGQPFATALIGAEEVNAQGTPNQGDPDGSGQADLTFNRGQNEVCYHLMVKDIQLPAVSAHIHFAPAGKNGPIVVQISPPDATGMSMGCVDADSDLVKRIGKNPSDYYVNVHNAEFLGGALRGQLGDNDQES
jgi:CHRD domain